MEITQAQLDKLTHAYRHLAIIAMHHELNGNEMILSKLALYEMAAVLQQLGVPLKTRTLEVWKGKVG